MSNQPHVLDVNQANFQNEVLQQSYKRPVIVDFWAPWCGPCRMLGPVLERLATQYNGRFLLAKVNSDLSPQLSMQYQVRGIPAVKAFVNGRAVDEFVGAQPEPRVRQFIDRVLAQAPAASAPKPETAVPDSPAARLQKAKELLRQGDGCTALKMLPGADGDEASQLRPLAAYLCDSKQGKLQGNDAQIGSLLQRREYSGALYNLLLEMNGGNGRARAVMAAVIALLGSQDPIAQAYQQQLTAG